MRTSPTLTLLLGMLLLILAACGGEGGAAPTPVVDTTAVPVGGFTISVTGDITTQFTGGTIFQDDPAIGKILYVFDPNTPVDAPGSGLTLVMPLDIQPGTYPLVSYNQVFDITTGAATRPGIYYYDAPTLATAGETFGIISAGELVLASVNPMTGTLIFTAGNEVDERKINVSATFNAIPLLPLPTPDTSLTPTPPA